MVKRCYRFNHPHEPGDSNYANAVDGLNAFIARIRRLRPHVFIENCEDGGNMMTFNMIRLYDTSIAADSTSSLASRQSVYGLSYPFPLTYSSRYMTEHTFTTLDTRSYMFGGPWILMQRLTQLSEASLEFLRGEIGIYKRLRESYPYARVYHLTQRPDDARIDAIQAHDERDGSGFVFVSRPLAPVTSYRLRPRGLDPDAEYDVSFQNAGRTVQISGSRLMTDGVLVNLPEARTAEIVYYSRN
jgi:alpha-galactosidase